MATSNDKIFQKYLKKMKTMNNMVSADEIYRALLNGKNTYLRMSRSESSHFDPSWIKVIEDCLYDLGEIVNNPYEVTKSVGNVVPVELAKKIDGESVQHLASHSQYVKEINEKGEVVPSKILSHSNEDNIHIYENRFIATFIRRLVLFIEKRYEFVIKTIPLYKDDVMIMKNKSVINGQEVEIETKIRVKKETDDDVGKAARAYADRIIKMREYVTYYYNSPFMRQMKNERDVKKPILQTNIIRKNPKYHHCYEAFTFIERFDALGVTYKVAEDYMNFDAKTRAEMNYLFFSTYLSLKDDKAFSRVKTNDKIYKPKILTSMDDEAFVYGPYLKGPIEFVRVDEQYRKYLQSKVKKDLPLHPTKEEREYYADEYALNKEIKQDEHELEKLIARKQREIAKFEKQVAKIIAQREKEEAELERLRQKQIKAEEDRRIEAKRQEIIAAALLRQAEMEAEIQRQKEELARLEALALAAKAEEEAKQAEEQPQEEIPEVLDTPEEEPVAEEQPVEEPVEEPAPEEPQPEEVVEEPVAEEAPVEEPQEQPAEEPKPEPKKRGRKKKVVEEPKEEEPSKVLSEPQEEAPVEEVKEEPAPEEVPAEESQPEEEPVQDEPVSEPEVEPEPVNEEPVVEEDPIEEQPVEEPQPEEQPAEEPISEPVSEELPQEEPVIEEKVEEAPVEEKPAPKKKGRKKKATEEPKEEEPSEVLDMPQEEPVEEKVEEPVSEPEPEEKPVKEKKQRKPRAKKEKPVVEEQPVEQEAPVEGQPQEEPIIEPVSEEKPQEEVPVEEVKEEPAKEPKKRKPRAKKEKKPEPEPEPEPVKEEPHKKERAKKEPEQLEKIPGKFIVKTYDGYYVNERKFSIYKQDAKIFDDFNVAKQIKARLGGKVVKL